MKTYVIRARYQTTFEGSVVKPDDHWMAIQAYRNHIPDSFEVRVPEYEVGDQCPHCTTPLVPFTIIESKIRGILPRCMICNWRPRLISDEIQIRWSE